MSSQAATGTIPAKRAALTDLDGPPVLRQTRDMPLFCNADGVHPPKANLWG